MAMVDLDDMSKAILEAIYQYGGEANTSEIKEYTGYEENRKLHYRREEHLEPADLVESETEDSGGTLPVTVWRLTEKGKRRVDTILGEDSRPPLERRVDDLREVVADLKTQVDTFDGRLDAVESDFEEVRDTVMSAEEVVKRAEEATEAAEAVVEDHAEVQEKRAELENRVHRMEEIERVAVEVGLVSEDALGDPEEPGMWDGGFVGGPLLRKLEKLDDAGALDGLWAEEGDPEAEFHPFEDVEGRETEASERR